jgi:D-glycero-D-manno-heptose 1,7-bisphosphate phosphatase
MPKAVFLDRDGVINRKAPDGQYITRWEDVEFLPRVAEAIALLNRARFSVIVVSNQRGVAKGLLSGEELERMHRRMVEHLAASNASITAVYFCPHDIEPACTCRKPAPGMLFQAAREHLIDLPNSWMVGDSDTDVQAGRNAGCKTVRILRSEVIPEIEADLSAPSLFKAAQKLIQLV